MENRPPNSVLNATLAPVHLPRIRIQFCTQCKWMLRAAYFAQELLSTFSTSLGEVSLIPSTGGVFTVDITHLSNTQPEKKEVVLGQGDERLITQTTRIWDRKAEGGFPETKTLKKLVRDIIDPSRDLGHVDRPKPAKQEPPPSSGSNLDKKDRPNAAPAGESVAAEENSLSGSRDEKGESVEGEKRPLAEPAQEQARRNGHENVCEDCK